MLYSESRTAPGCVEIRSKFLPNLDDPLDHAHGIHYGANTEEAIHRGDAQGEETIFVAGMVREQAWKQAGRK